MKKKNDFVSKTSFSASTGKFEKFSENVIFGQKLAFFSQELNFHFFLLKTVFFNLQSKDLKTKLNLKAPEKSTDF